MPTSRPTKLLNIATKTCFVRIALSQLLFTFYILKFYGGNAINNTPEAWNDMTIKGYETGDTVGNFMFASHMGLAVIIILAGLIQLLPWVRKNAIKLHRYSGRVYIFTAVLLSLGGLYLVWIRDATLSMNGSVAISINALLIIIFSFFTIKTARAGQIKTHRKWALRTFIVVSGVWFFRVGFMAWIMIHQEAKWSTENLDGPFDLVFAYANYLLPLIILELYFSFRESKEKKKQYILSSILFLSAILVCLGTVGSYLFMWAPNM